jgi:predicted subunit of tRNA(5-methylaminomethyl-2-thiouridylate) methyltransferase
VLGWIKQHIEREAWDVSQQTNESRIEKIMALTLAKECYAMKLELITNATVVDDAIRFVSSHAMAAVTERDNAAYSFTLNKDREISKNDIQSSESNSRPKPTTTAIVTTKNSIF